MSPLFEKNPVVSSCRLLQEDNHAKMHYGHPIVATESNQQNIGN